MSFAEGFGSAFSKSFNAGLEREEEKKKDAFRIAYADYMDRRKTYDEDKKKDAARVGQAKSLAKAAGLPEDQWTVAYDMVGTGMSGSDILEELRTGTISDGSAPTTSGNGTASPAPSTGEPEAPKTPTPEAAFPTPGLGTQPQGDATPPTPAKASTGQNPESIAPGEEGYTPPEAPAPSGIVAPPAQADEQMASLGVGQSMPTPQAPAPAAPAKKSAANVTGLLSNLSGKFKGGSAPATTGAPAMANPAGNDAMKRIGGALGQSPDQIAATMNKTYTPGQDVPANNLKFTPAAPARKADPISGIQESWAERDAAKIAYEQNPGDMVAKQRYEASEVRLNASKGAAVFAAGADSRAKGTLPQGVAGVVVDPLTGASEPVSLSQDVETGKWKNAITGADIAGVAIPFTPEETKYVKEIAEKASTQVKDFNEKAAAVVPALRSAGVLNQLVEDSNGQVLHGMTGSLAKGAVGIAGDVGNVLSLTMSAAQQNGAVDPAQVEKLRSLTGAAGADLQAALGTDVNRLANQQTLFDAQVYVMAVDMAKAKGMSGANLSNKDVMQNIEVLKGGTTKDTFRENMANQVGSLIAGLNANKGAVLEYNNMLEGWKTFSGNKPLPYKPIAADLDQLIISANDPSVTAGYNLVKSYAPAGANSGAGMVQNAQSNQGAGTAPTTAQAPATPAVPVAGKTVVNGFVYQGGDPNAQSSWVKQ